MHFVSFSNTVVQTKSKRYLEHLGFHLLLPECVSNCSASHKQGLQAQPRRQTPLSRIFRSRSLCKNTASLPKHKEETPNNPRNAYLSESKSLQCYVGVYVINVAIKLCGAMTRPDSMRLLSLFLQSIYLTRPINVISFYSLNKSIVFTTD